ncbi:MAG: formate hydrogenlyase [Symbiobacteriia bacterium]
MNALLIAALLITVLLAGMRRLDHAAVWLGLQAAALGSMTLWLGWTGHSGELYLAGALTLLAKGIVIPVVLLRVLHRLERKVDPHPLLMPELAVALAIGLMVLAKAIIPANLFGDRGFDPFIIVGTGMVMTGLLMMVTRRQVIAQVEGLVVMENGIYLAVLGATRGMPFAVELGVLFDLLVAVLILSSLTFRIGTTLDSLNTDRLRGLKG